MLICGCDCDDEDEESDGEECDETPYPLVHTINCTFEDNEAIMSGGALHVEQKAAVHLQDQTVLLGNKAQNAGTLRVKRGQGEGTLSYTLPSPLARWVLVSEGNVSYIQGDLDLDFPYACPGGVLGTSFDVRAQTSPECSAQCPQVSNAHTA